MKKRLLSSLKTYGNNKLDYALKRIRYFQLLSYISLTGNILFIITIFYILKKR